MQNKGTFHLVKRSGVGHKQFDILLSYVGNQAPITSELTLELVLLKVDESLAL